MEDVMFGTKRTIPFWRAKRQLLTLERALASDRMAAARVGFMAHAVADARAASRLSAEAKKKARFFER
jgi:hypothetical protein